MIVVVDSVIIVVVVFVAVVDVTVVTTESIIYRLYPEKLPLAFLRLRFKPVSILSIVIIRFKNVFSISLIIYNNSCNRRNSENRKDHLRSRLRNRSQR